MKKLIKKIFFQFRLLDFARFIYNGLQKLSLETITKEIRYRTQSLPDLYPAPPARLIFLIIGTPWLSEYWNSGIAIVENLLFHFSKNDLSQKKFSKILDFGCGCGRLTRHLTRFNNAALYGSDYNPELITWCNANLTLGKFSTNKLEPPLQYQDNFFDLVIARSVFTHLGNDLQIQWINELYRVLAPGGILYFTTHGNFLAQFLEVTDQQKFYNNELVVQYENLEGDNKCTTFESTEWVLHNLLGNFHNIVHIPGTSEKDLRQDTYIFQKPN